MTAEDQVKPDINYTDFTVPEGFNKPSDEFIQTAKDIGLTQENAQKMIDFYTKNLAPAMQKAQQDQFSKLSHEWADQSIKTIGNDGIEKAKIAFKEFATPELKSLLNTTGLSNHPLVIGMFKTIGDKMGEGNLINGGNSAEQLKRTEDILFGN